MKKTRRLKRLRHQLKDYLRKHHVGIIGIVLSISLFSITFHSGQYALRLAESWRDAYFRSLEVILEGGKAHPFRAPDKWAVSFQQEPSVQVNFQVSASVVLIKGNSTLEAEQANVTGN